MSDSGDFFHELGAGKSKGDFRESCQFCHDVDEIVCGIFGQECVEHVLVEGHVHCHNSFQGSEEDVVEFP